MGHLQTLYEKYNGETFTILGFNPADNRQIALNFLRDEGITFPTVLDSSYEALHTLQDYGEPGPPTLFAIDGQGRIASDSHTIGALEKSLNDLGLHKQRH